MTRKGWYGERQRHSESARGIRTSQPIRHIGSQTRENIETTDYVIVQKSGNEVIVYDKDADNYELWVKRDDYAGYVIDIDGIGYEFAHSIKLRDVLSYLPDYMDSVDKVKKLMKIEDIPTDLASPNFVSDFAWNRGGTPNKISSLTSDEVVEISNTYKNKKNKWIIKHIDTDGAVADKTFNTENEAYQWWESHSQKYPEMDVEIEKLKEE